MKRVTIQYHYDGQWWADSPDVPGYTAVAASFDELRAVVADGIDFFVDEPVVLVEEAALFASPMTAGDDVVGGESTSGNPDLWETQRVAFAG